MESLSAFYTKRTDMHGCNYVLISQFSGLKFAQYIFNLHAGHTAYASVIIIF